MFVGGYTGGPDGKESPHNAGDPNPEIHAHSPPLSAEGLQSWTVSTGGLGSLCDEQISSHRLAVHSVKVTSHLLG